MDSPHAQENEFMLMYNKEQLKKLKGGITYLNTWKLKHKPKTSISYRKERSRELEDEDIVGTKGKREEGK